MVEIEELGPGEYSYNGVVFYAQGDGTWYDDNDNKADWFVQSRLNAALMNSQYPFGKDR